MLRYRLTFYKGGNAAYISHLDLMRMFQRAFFRSGAQARHTQGFNPHLYISIARPLPVGMTGLRELLDFECEKPPEEDFVSALNEALPEDVRALSCSPAQAPFKQIAWARCSLRWLYSGCPDTTERLNRLFSGRTLTVIKKSKSGEREVDISRLIKEIAFSEAEGGILCKAVLSSGAEELNPRYVTQAAEKDGVPVAHAEYTRECFLDAQLRPF